MTRASERNGELQLRMRVRISAHVLERCFGAFRMCLCPLLHHDQCEAIQTTFPGTLGLSLFRRSGEEVATCFNSARPESSNLVWPTKLGEMKDLHAEVQAAVVGLADAPSPPRSSPLQAGRAQGPQPADLSCYRVLVTFANVGRR